MQIVDKYEYMGFELGDKVVHKKNDKIGVIIGFDIKNKDVCISISEKGRFTFYNEREFYPDYWYFYDNIDVETDYFWSRIEYIEKLPKKSKLEEKINLNVNIINPLIEIRKIIKNETFKLELYSEEFCISLYDSEVPITWSKKSGLQLDYEICNVNLTLDMVQEVKDVMELIQNNLKWFTNMLDNQS